MFLAQGVPLLIRVRREGLWAAHQREVSAQRQAEGQAAQRRRRNCRPSRRRISLYTHRGQSERSGRRAWAVQTRERAEGAPEVL
jgi:hypothetical protein